LKKQKTHLSVSQFFCATSKGSDLIQRNESLKNMPKKLVTSQMEKLFSINLRISFFKHCLYAHENSQKE
jgi:ribosome-binding protein aMBF1 (putative translation factor)